MLKRASRFLAALAMAAAMVGAAIPVAAYADPNSIQLPDGTIIWVDDDGNVVAEGDARWLTLADGTEALVDTDGTVAWYRGGYLETLPDGTAAWVDEYEKRVVARGAQRLELADGTVAWVDEGGKVVDSPSVADAVVALGRESYAYDGTAKDPGVASVTFHGLRLAEGADYRVERPAGRTNAGTYAYVVRGVNGFAGTSSASFRIERAANGMRVRKSTRKVAAARVAKKKRVVRPLRVTGASGRVRYRRLSKGSSKRLLVNARTGKVTVRKGTKPGTYTVRIRVAAAGDANHRAAAKTVTCKVVVK